MIKLICCLTILQLLFIPCTTAQNDVNYAVYANIIYRFTRYIDWPEDKKTGDFVIGVVGNSPIYDDLKNSVLNKTVGSQKIVLRQYSFSSDVRSCHILFVGESAEKNFKKMVIATEGTSTLLISEGSGLASKGACINFSLEDEHLKLEINKNKIEERKLNIASELLSLGVLVK